MITHSPETVMIWLSAGIPARLIWAGRHYAVTDTPTPLEDFMMGITHPPAVDGWRFQGTGDDGESHIFDVRRRNDANGHDPGRPDDPGEWEIVRVYD